MSAAIAKQPKPKAWGPPPGVLAVELTAATPRGHHRRKCLVWQGERNITAQLIGYKGHFPVFRLPDGPDGAPRYRFIPYWSTGGYIFSGAAGVRLHDCFEGSEL